MKNAFGKLLIVIVLILSVYLYADDPAPTPYLNTTNECGSPMGIVSAVDLSAGSFDYYVFKSGEWLGTSGYFALGRRSGQNITFGFYYIYWRDSPYNYWVSMNYASIQLSACEQLYRDYLVGINGTELVLDLQGTIDGYFPSSRYDLTADDDADGMLDYYDLDCERYDEYLQICEDNAIEPKDLVDYQYFQDNEIEDWLAKRNDMTDTDGDGFSDGFELIHGTDIYDGTNYPLGIPDVGGSLLVVGAVYDPEPWRGEQYGDSGYSRGFVYDEGYDPFGTETLTFTEDPDWGLIDSDNDGLLNYAELANGTDPYRFELQSGFNYIYDEATSSYSVAGYSDDGAFGDYDPPTEEEWLAAHEEYEPGNYTFNPSEYAFGVSEYDALLSKTDKIQFNLDDVRPQAERDYKLTFNLPIPGEGQGSFSVSVMPDVSTPAGAAMERVRLTIRGLCAVVLSYVFVKHVWLVIRQY